MTKILNVAREIFNKYSFLSPVMVLCATVTILWLNTKYVTKDEFSEHLKTDKYLIEDLQKSNDSTHKEIIINAEISHKELIKTFGEFDKKLDALLIGKETMLKQFEFIALLQKKQDDEISDLKSRMLYLERQKILSDSK